VTARNIAAEIRDPHTGRQIEAPDVHAGKLHALLAGLDCLHDTPLVFEEGDKSNIRGWLIHMAREESSLLRLSLDPAALTKGGAQ
jgi:hypothetical protein